MDNIRKIAVVGCGVTGQGMCRTFAQNGFDVIFQDVDEKKVREGFQEITELLDYEIERWGITATDKKIILSRIQGTTKKEDLKGCDIVLEAVPEKFEVKSKVFTALNKVFPPHIIFCTNTSTLSISGLASSSGRPECFVGMHFAYPVHKRAVVEIIRGLETNDETVRVAKELARAIGKEPVEVFEYPGYILTRAIIPFLNEAMFMVMEGVASAEDIDKAVRLGYNLPVGPLQLADQLGLEEILVWMEQLFQELGDLKYRPCPLLRKMVRAGQLGLKSGHGFFHYDEDGKRLD